MEAMRSIMVFCPTHKLGFSTAGLKQAISCCSGLHLLKDAGQPLQHWEYCCGCSNFWPLNIRPMTICPVCDRLMQERFYCGNCLVMLAEVQNSPKRRTITLNEQGLPQPFCPGCQLDCNSETCQHSCETIGIAFYTNSDICPFCSIPIRTTEVSNTSITFQPAYTVDPPKIVTEPALPPKRSRLPRYIAIIPATIIFIVMILLLNRYQDISLQGKLEHALANNQYCFVKENLQYNRNSQKQDAFSLKMLEMLKTKGEECLLQKYFDSLDPVAGWAEIRCLYQFLQHIYGDEEFRIQVLYSEANLAYKQNNFTSALDAYQQALNYPNWKYRALAINGIANTYLKMYGEEGTQDQLKNRVSPNELKAVEFFRKAASEDIHFALASKQLGDYYFTKASPWEKTNFRQASQYYKKAIPFYQEYLQRSSNESKKAVVRNRIEDMQKRMRLWGL
ncbi:MAG: hypothetical protein AB1489_28435 [Acidobacteriota bacterium]